MKFGVAVDGNLVSNHFGHCQGFMIYEKNPGKMMERRFVENPGHQPGYLPVFLKEQEIETVIAGGMGKRAQELFEEQGIHVIVGARGMSDGAALSYVNGELRSTKSVCTEHAYEGHCND